MNNVRAFPGCDLPPKQVLQDAIYEQLDAVAIVGWKGGKLFISASMGQDSDLVMVLQLAIQEILESHRGH